MTYRYYIFNGDSWVECSFRTYSEWGGQKHRSAFNVLDDLNNGKIKPEKKSFLIGASVELEVESNSLQEAKDKFYNDLLKLGYDIGDVSGFEVPDDEEEYDMEY